ncbi:MAG: hypothetical protein N4A33_06060 [Bacteriovoracaceae bacterium]|jgi:hypothetical protein|nr:hypothetical protein [Bacteriovoracaceae bacterium]
MKTLFLMTILSFGLLAKETQIMELFKSHLKSIQTQNKKEFISTITDDYLKQMKKTQYIKRLFSVQKKSSQKIDFDLKIKKTAKENVFFVNLKDKKEKNYHHIWYKVVKTKENKFLISGTVHLD